MCLPACGVPRQLWNSFSHTNTCLLSQRTLSKFFWVVYKLRNIFFCADNKHHEHKDLEQCRPVRQLWFKVVGHQIDCTPSHPLPPTTTPTNKHTNTHTRAHLAWLCFLCKIYRLYHSQINKNTKNRYIDIQQWQSSLFTSSSRSHFECSLIKHFFLCQKSDCYRAIGAIMENPG